MSLFRSRGLVGGALLGVLIMAILLLGTPAAPTGTAAVPTLAVLPTLPDEQTAGPTETPTRLPATFTATPLPATATLQPTAAPTTMDPTIVPLATAAPALPPPPLDESPLPDQVVIQFAESTTPEQQTAYLNQIGGTISNRIDGLNTVVVQAPAITPDNLPVSEWVSLAEPNYRVYAQGTPNDPQYSNQWGLPVIRANEAWDELPASPDTVVVAVVDSGICASHPDLQGRILPGWDYVQNDSVPQDDYGHGCAVSGIIAANTNNATGMAGIAPNVMIMPLRVLDGSGNGSFVNVASAIMYAADHDADIINLSLGGASYSGLLESAVNYAGDRGLLMIAAAGNTNGGSVLYPAALARVVAVGSVDRYTLQRSSFSAVGPEIDTWAPGRDILTTQTNGSYGYWNGTSFAAPMVTGVAALENAFSRSLNLNGGMITVSLPPPPTPTPTITPNPRPELPLELQSQQSVTLTDDWVVRLAPGSDANAVASALGYTNLGPVAGLTDWYLFRVPGSGSSLSAAAAAQGAFASHPAIQRAEQQELRQQFSRTPDDEPLYTTFTSNEQWHLRSSYSLPPWLSLNLPITQWVAGTINGAGVQIAIVDDGLQRTHPDLAPNYNAAGSFDFNFNDSDPMPGSNDPHGTAAGGVAAAADNPAPNYNLNNGADYQFCGVGVAYGASLAGIRLISQSVTANAEAQALSYQPQLNDIYNNSWGPSDDGATLGYQAQIVRDALAAGVANGRGGLGSIYVWAAGNGRAVRAQSGQIFPLYDNVNADEYANSRYVIAVGATGPYGQPSYYSEPGAAMLVSAPSSDTGVGIATTDLMGSVGYNTGSGGDYSFPSPPTITTNNYGCTKNFGGTSAATPMVAGVVALMLQANPDLTWRDVQHILVETARPRLGNLGGWTTNAAGYDISHDYGFGVVDTAAAVALAPTWTSVDDEISYQPPGITVVNKTIPAVASGAGGIISSITVPANIKIEHVEVIFNATHEYRGDIEVNLTAPSGTVSQLMNERIYDDGNDFTNWRFMTVRNWGEHSAGSWTLNVVDRFPALDNGTFQNWTIIIYGTPTGPRAPSPTTPTAGAAISSITPSTPVNFTWTTPHVYADRLEVQVDTQNPPASTATSILMPASGHTLNLPYGTYYWRIRAAVSDGNGGELFSDWSPVRSFTLGSPANSAPLINAEENTQPTLSWNRVTNAARYEFRLSTSSTMAGTPLIYVTDITPDTTSYTPVTPLAAGVYYWQVRACTSASATSCGTWSAITTLVRLDP